VLSLHFIRLNKKELEHAPFIYSASLHPYTVCHKKNKKNPNENLIFPPKKNKKLSLNDETLIFEISVLIFF